jgi:sugar lactone lactonase YvrE
MFSRKAPLVVVLALAALLLRPPATHAAAALLDEPASYPEGPTIVDGALYWAEMPTHRIRRYKDGRATTVWEQPDCSPTSIKPDARGGFWILCHLEHKVLRVNRKFEKIVELDRDGAGNRLVWPNDATSDHLGQLYFTSAGLFDLRAPAEGAVYFIDTSDRVVRLFGGLRYANGVHLDEKHARLYVSEHLNRKVHVMDVERPGKVGPRRLFFDLNVPALRPPEYPLAGPDGLLVDPAGNLYIAEYGAGRILLVSPTGALQRVIAVPMQYVTNFAYWRERNQIVVVGALQNDVMPMPGRVISLPR